MTFFQNIPEAPIDPVLGLVGAFKADPRKEKVSLAIGIYMDEALEAKYFPSVEKAIKGASPVDYLPIDGSSELVEALSHLVFKEKVYGAHSVGGTGALRVGAEFVRDHIGKAIYVSNPTWPNHRLVFERAGLLVREYPHNDIANSLEKLPEGSVVLLHACCHNPTGVDPTPTEWREIAKVMKRRRLLPFFDAAYQGFGDGIEADVASIRIFREAGLEMLVAYSCSKNFSMYSQRVGVLFVTGNVASQIKRTARALYSNPPAFGAKVVERVLKEHRSEWEHDINQARTRLDETRAIFAQKLKMRLDSKGMFCMLPLSKEQVRCLREKWGVYMTDNGRVSLTGLNRKNMDYVVSAICDVR